MKTPEEAIESVSQLVLASQGFGRYDLVYHLQDVFEALTGRRATGEELELMGAEAPEPFGHGHGNVADDRGGQDMRPGEP